MRKLDLPILPSEKAAKKAADQAQVEELRKEQESHLRIILNGCFQTPDGVQVLKWLMAQCHFGKQITLADDRSMILGVLRLNLYNEIRKHLNSDILKKVENDR